MITGPAGRVRGCIAPRPAPPRPGVALVNLLPTASQYLYFAILVRNRRLGKVSPTLRLRSAESGSLVSTEPNLDLGGGVEGESCDQG